MRSRIGHESYPKWTRWIQIQGREGRIIITCHSQSFANEWESTGSKRKCNLGKTGRIDWGFLRVQRRDARSYPNSTNIAVT